MTWLSRLHPYPAMIADSLATSLAAEYVEAGSIVFDPFCGTGRTLMAASALGGRGIGIDINPLAVLITRAKASRISAHEVRELHDCLATSPRSGPVVVSATAAAHRTVTWFSEKARRELSEIIASINHLSLRKPLLLPVAALLSATVRDVSYCRKDAWKLHRLSGGERSAFRPSAWKVFLSRLNGLAKALDAGARPTGGVDAHVGDARHVVKEVGAGRVDLVITSPPYGDSRSTVQYGAMSSLCLSVLRLLHGLGDDLKPVDGGRDIDRCCLGGTYDSFRPEFVGARKYWYGKPGTQVGVATSRFLADMTAVGGQITQVLRPGGRAVFIVGRRLAGSFRLRLDEFLVDSLATGGLQLESRTVRPVPCKWTPSVVRRWARSRVRRESVGALVRTMAEEQVLIFRQR